MRDMGYLEGFPCAITQEALNQVKDKMLSRYEMELSDYQALWLCGFVVDGTASLTIMENIYRQQTQPSKVKSGEVWRGWVRNEVNVKNPIDSKGRIVYTNKLHHLQPLYFSCEIVTGDVITDDIMDILEIGSLQEYNKERKIECERVKPVDMNDYEE